MNKTSKIIAIIRENESEIANIQGVKIETKGVESKVHIENKMALANELALRVSSEARMILPDRLQNISGDMFSL